MESDSWRWAVLLLLIALNAFFVTAEYALIGAGRSRIEVLAGRGSRSARSVFSALSNLPYYVAGIQLAITMSGIGLGWISESTIASFLEPLFEGIGVHVLATAMAFLLVTFFMVVLGELVPKYLTLRAADRTALAIILPLNAALFLLRPFTLLLETAGYLVLRPFGVNIRRQQRPVVAKEEIAALIRESRSAGVFDETHARMVTKALNLVELQADDVMIPRVDIAAVDVNLSKNELLSVLVKQPHTRLVAVVDGDIDEVAGVLHIQDVFRLLNGEAEDIRAILRPAVFVPPNLSLENLIEMMRKEKTQILIVRDEHGGTEGLLTLEDIVEEVFGELDDQVEHAQPPIERRVDGRVTMRGDVRTDELVEFLGLDDNPLEREPISTIILTLLGRTPRLGDVVETPLGRLQVDNMARQRITRVSLIPAPPQAAAN